MVELVVVTEQVLTDTVVAGVADLLADRVRAGAALGWVAPPSAPEVADLLRALAFEGPDRACGLIATVDGEVAGFGYWRRYQRPTLAVHADLDKIAVSADRAGQGVGRVLLRGLIDRARGAGVEQLTLDFRGDNTPAERLYRSEGFVEYGRLRDFVAPDADRRFDRVLHVLDLRS